MWLGELKTSGILSYFIAKRKLLVNFMAGPVAQSVVSLIADPGFFNLITARCHTSLEIDHDIFYRPLSQACLGKMCG